MRNSTIPNTSVDPDSQVPLLARLTVAGRELLARTVDVAGDLVVNASGPAPVAELAELLDLGLVERMPSGAYRLTSRGMAVWLFVPQPRRETITVQADDIRRGDVLVTSDAVETVVSAGPSPDDSCWEDLVRVTMAGGRVWESRAENTYSVIRSR